MRPKALIGRKTSDIAPDDIQVGAAPEIKGLQIVGEDHTVGHLQIAQLPSLDVDCGTKQARTAVIQLLDGHAFERDIRRGVSRRIDVRVDNPLDIGIRLARQQKRRHPERRPAEERDDDGYGWPANNQKL